MVPYEAPEYAAAEIDRLGDHPGFVQLMLGDPHQRAARSTQVLADVRSGRGARSADRHPLRRSGRLRRSLARAGRRSTSRTTPGCRRRSRRRSSASSTRASSSEFPKPQDRADRGRIRLGPAAGLAAGCGLAQAGRRGAAAAAQAVRVLRRALLAHHAADGGAGAAPSSSCSCWSRRRGCRTG